jgi:hypothetical protein
MALILARTMMNESINFWGEDINGGLGGPLLQSPC